MDIGEAFHHEAISDAGVDVNEQEEGQLRAFLGELLNRGEMSPGDVVEVAILSFVAGRTYQSQFSDAEDITVSMNTETVKQFINYLSERGSRGV